jgi:hypothetical protein
LLLLEDINRYTNNYLEVCPNAVCPNAVPEVVCPNPPEDCPNGADPEDAG